MNEGSVMKVVLMEFYWNHVLISLLWDLFTEFTLL